MKNVLKASALALTLLIGLSSSVAAAPRQWEVHMQGLPEETTSKKLRITYSVISNDESDDFTVHLVQNGEIVATQKVTTPGGDSSVFEVTVPASGTYSFAITAQNSNAGNKNSQPDVIRVVEPVQAQPSTVNTVFISSTGGRGGSGNTTSGSGGSTETGGRVLSEGAEIAQNTTSDDATDTGNTTDEATSDESANTENQNEEQETEETTVEAGNGDGVQLAVILALLAAAVGYGAYRYNPRTKE